MTIAERNIHALFQEVRELRARVSGLVPLDREGEYKKSFLHKLDRARASRTRFTFKGGVFSRMK